MSGDKPKQKDATLTDVYNVLKELLKWVKFSGTKEVKSTLETNLLSDEEKIIYALSNGANSSYEIARIMGANDTVRRKISDYWDRWETAGLGEPVASQGKGKRFKRSFNLEDFGITTPQISTSEKSKLQAATGPQISDQPLQEADSNA